MKLTKREERCLRRIADRKSIPDFQGVGFLIDKGLVTMDGAGGSDDVKIEVTEAGRAALSDNRTNEEGGK